MNRNIWEKIIGFSSIQAYPKLPCPYCFDEALSIDIDSIHYRKSTCSSTAALIQKENASKIEAISFIAQRSIFLGVLAGIGALALNTPKEPAKFICFYNCRSCGGDVSATGTSQYPTGTPNTNSNNVPTIKVEYFSPPLPIFNVSATVPDAVRNEVLQSFNHFHSDISSSGAKLRRSVEKLCATLGFQERNLHLSISAMEKQFPEEANFLHSLKLLGNEATHADSVHEQDLLDAFEVLDFVLGVYDRIEAKKLIDEKAQKLRLKFDRKNLPNLEKKL